MAKYEINGKEVTEEEFNKQVFKGVEESPFFLDEVITGFHSFFGENRSEEDILKNLLNPNLKGTKLRDEWKEKTVNMNKSKGDNIFKDVTWKSAELSPENKEKLQWIRVLAKKSAEKEKLTKDKNTIINTQNFKLTDILDIVKAESEEELEDILKRNMNIGAPDMDNSYESKSPIYGTISHTGGTVFEKVQDSSIPNKNIDPFYVVDIKNTSKVDLKRNDLDEMLDYVFRGLYEDKQDPLDAYNAITGHSTKHKSQGVKQEDLGKGINNPPNPIKSWQPVPKIGKKEAKTVEKAPIFTYCKQMKNAIEALSLRSLYGHKKYEKGDDWENFSRVENGEFEYSNAEFRHALGIGVDEDEEQHLIAGAWNAVARLELYLRNKNK